MQKLPSEESQKKQVTREFDLDHIFTYHAPMGDQIYNYNRIRAAAKVFASILLDCTPVSADQSDAIRKLRECVHMANSSIALEGRLHKP